ncbi:hypothetical protein DNL40_08185 [Xylanimonas oleitrophica]|uniref:LppM domain-containing protein n=1 Tax=Xylanimonas oleitrophica TaxID=2607479 RepID=A0A2W5WS60_9MICO|nr:hypothetical protein [Xylanimonas oleitrophica]PZR53473.1 hypothetical protein DNL40_08185 [Xylanimonas oleitrophica]
MRSSPPSTSPRPAPSTVSPPSPRATASLGHAARRRPLAALGTALVVALALAGCVKVDVGMTVSPDDTMAGTMVFAFADDAAAQLGADPQQLWDQAGGQITGQLPEGATEEPYAQDGWTGTRVTLPPTPIGQTATVGGEQLTVVREGDEYVASGVMDLTSLAEGQENVPQAVLDEMQIDLSVTFPGPVTETDGTADGSTARWQPAPGQRTEISARASALPTGAAPSPSASPSVPVAADDDGATTTATDEDGAPWPWLALAAAVLVLLAALAAVLGARSRRRKEAAAQAPPGTYTPGSHPPGPPSSPTAGPTSGPDA